MQVKAIKTHKITSEDKNIFSILDRYLLRFSEKTIVVVTSKIVSICEGRIVKKTSKDQKDMLAQKEADYYLPREYSQYGFMISVNRNIMVASAGIDESNGNGYYVLWPKNPQESVNKIRTYLSKKYGIKKLGIIISDSRLSPLRWGVTGVSIAHSGFKSIYSYVGKPDIFGRKMRAEKSNIADSLATAAVLVMGEGDEQSPLAIISDIDFIDFQERNPTKSEIDSTKISFKDDVYASMLTSVPWKKGNK